MVVIFDHEIPSGLVTSPGHDTPVPLEGVSASRRQRAIRLAILRLPIRYRWLYMAQSVGDYTNLELARAHRVSVRTVQRWKVKMLERLAQEARRVERKLKGI